jgi:hypothetical protein
MDPFLEHPAIFPGLHDRLIYGLSEALQPELPEPYYAEISDRVWVEISERLIGTDVDVLRRDEQSATPQNSVRDSRVATAVRSKRVVVRVPHDERREPALEIYARLDGERLVTTIEVLSLANKTPGEQGRELYSRKQREILRSKVNLVEIDLLRAGDHTTAVPRDRAIDKAGPFDYHVCIHRFDNLEDYFVYPILMSEPLPEIAIPLLPGDADVDVDLQVVFNRCYDAGPYRRRVRYDKDVPLPPLDDEQAKWAAELLAEP